MRKNKMLTVLLSLALLFSVFGCVSTSPKVGTVTDLVIIGTTDVHANVYSFSYEDNKETTNNGLARISTYVNELRKNNPNVVLIDTGDTYQGTIMSDAIYNKNLQWEHPVSKAMNYMKYDAFVLGNHEFNFGMPLVEKIMKELQMPTLAANASYTNGKPLAKPYTIIERNGIKIGIIGLTNPNIPRWDGEKVKDVTFASIPDTAAKYVKELKEKKKVDIIIMGVHAGWEAEYDETKKSDSVSAIYSMTDKVDATLVGHMHITVNKNENNVLVGGSRASGRELVRIDMKVEKTSAGYKVISKEIKNIVMDQVKPDEGLRKLIQADHERTLHFIKDGTAADGAGASGGGVFGIASANFQPVNEISSIPEGQLRDTAVITLIGKSQLAQSGADVTSVALFKDTSDLKKGTINYASLFDIYKFDNNLYTMKITGKELKAYMEWSASFYNTWKPGDLNISFNEEIPGYRYDMFKGVEYKIDLSKPAGQRIIDVTFKGAPLKDDQVLKLAVNNYRYSSGIKASKLAAGTRDWESPLAIRDYLAEYIKKAGTIDPVVDNNWQIVGVSLDHPLRAEIIKLVNAGVIPSPKFKSLNIDDLTKAGFIKDGKVVVPTK